MLNGAFVTFYFHFHNNFLATVIVVMMLQKLTIGAHVERMSVGFFWEDPGFSVTLQEQTP